MPSSLTLRLRVCSPGHLFSPASSLAQLDTGNPLAGLEKLKDFTSARVSSSDPDWHNGNGDCRWIKPGGTLTLAELSAQSSVRRFILISSDKAVSCQSHWRTYQSLVEGKLMKKKGRM